jgi:mRNA interferase MazF
MVSYFRGDVVVASPKSNEGNTRPAVIVQADWFNIGSPPSYLICLLSSSVYPELDFRPIVEPSIDNGLSVTSQVMIDKLQVVKLAQIGKKIGVLDAKTLRMISGQLKSILSL